jgi:hypothetical protein
MPRHKKTIKHNKFNKYIGGAPPASTTAATPPPASTPAASTPAASTPAATSQETTAGILVNSAVQAFGSITGFVGDKTARIFGYQKINGPNPGVTSSVPSVGMNKITSGMTQMAQGIGTTVLDTVNKNFLQNNGVKTQFAISLDAFNKSASSFLQIASKKISNPVVIQSMKDSINRFSNAASHLYAVASPAINKMIDQYSAIFEKFGSKMGKSVVKGALDSLGALPGFGELLEGLRVMDDVSSGIFAAMGAASSTFKTTAVGLSTIQNSNNALNKKQQEVADVSTRTNQNINKFSNTDTPAPKPTTAKGGTNRRFTRKNSIYSSS